ncbi:MAG: hypothetical protein OEZ58_00040 [Gammaproteobacteria bacterium]|nr:hypothetical protein [Gammaproteobacteria bacterium]
MAIANLLIGKIRCSLDLPNSFVEQLEQHMSSDKTHELDEDCAIEMMEWFRCRFPTKTRPSSIMQLKYAKNIADRLGIELPKNIGISVVCSQFIEDHVKAFENRYQKTPTYNQTVREIERVCRWMSAKGKIEAGQSIEAVAEDLGVSVSTIETYLRKLYRWLQNNEGTEKHKAVLTIFEKVRTRTSKDCI